MTAVDDHAEVGPRQQVWLRSMAVALAMLCASALAVWAQPNRQISKELGIPDLGQMVPSAFGQWELDPTVVPLIADPTLDLRLRQLYSAQLNRTYVNPAGQRVMLSIAYGEDQRDGMQVHRPEVCYPSQGFKVESVAKGSLKIGNDTIPVRRVVTNFADQFTEPVTYWTTIGNQVTGGGVDKKLIEMRYALRREIPDGLLFRVSSRGERIEEEFEMHRRFAAELSSVLSTQARLRLMGGSVSPVEH